MKQVLVVVGPTAVGKSDYGIRLAKQFDGEIISGDSIQLYRGFDIGSGKCTKEEMNGVPHYLIDRLNSREKTSVADFQRDARYRIEEISRRGRLPILVGGTGLYIKACLYDYEFEAETPVDLSDLEKLDNEALYERLKALDAASAAKIHPNNRKRTLRALSIARSGQIKSEREAAQQHRPIYDALILGLTCERETLAQRISTRVDRMIAAGLRDEVEGLLKSGVQFSDQAMQGIGYREWQAYFENNATLEETKEAIKTHSRQFAKRQYTWLHHQMDVTWLDIEQDGWQESGVKIVEEWRKRHE